MFIIFVAKPPENTQLEKGENQRDFCVEMSTRPQADHRIVHYKIRAFAVIASNLSEKISRIGGQETACVLTVQETACVLTVAMPSPACRSGPVAASPGSYSEECVCHNTHQLTSVFECILWHVHSSHDSSE